MTGGIVILKLVKKVLRKILILSVKHNFSPPFNHESEDDNSTMLHILPEDVKEGHFVVHTVDDGELRRFIIELSYLAHPGFLKLLEQAEEEFGLKQIGILAIPCRYSELQTVLESNENIKALS